MKALRDRVWYVPLRRVRERRHGRLQGRDRGARDERLQGGLGDLPLKACHRVSGIGGARTNRSKLVCAACVMAACVSGVSCEEEVELEDEEEPFEGAGVDPF